MADNHNVNARLTSIHKDVLSQLGITTNGSGTVTNSVIEAIETSTTDTITALSDGSQKSQLVDESGNFLYPSGLPYVESVEITRPADTTAYSPNDAINDSVYTAQVETITLTGTAPTKQKDEITLTGTSGTAEITLAGGLTKTVTFATGGTLDLSQTALDFATSFAADYLAEGIVVTADAAKIVFEASNYGIPFTSPAIANLTEDLAGTVANVVTNVVVGAATITVAGGVTGDVVFDTAGAVDLAATASNYVTAYELDYASEGITLTSSGADIIFTASSAGTPFLAPIITNVTGDLTGTVVHTTPNVTPGAFEFEQMAIANGGGGYIMDVKIESDMTTLAGTTVRVWLFNETPIGIIGDNVAFVNAYADKDKRIGYIDVEMDALLGSSTSVIGQVSVIKEYKCADTSLFALVQTITGFTPTSAGKLDIMFNVLKLS